MLKMNDHANRNVWDLFSDVPAKELTEYGTSEESKKSCSPGPEAEESKSPRRGKGKGRKSPRRSPRKSPQKSPPKTAKEKTGKEKSLFIPSLNKLKNKFKLAGPSFAKQITSKDSEAKKEEHAVIKEEVKDITATESSCDTPGNRKTGSNIFESVHGLLTIDLDRDDKINKESTVKPFHAASALSRRPSQNGANKPTKGKKEIRPSNAASVISRRPSGSTKEPFPLDLSRAKSALSVKGNNKSCTRSPEFPLDLSLPKESDSGSASPSSPAVSLPTSLNETCLKPPPVQRVKPFTKSSSATILEPRSPIRKVSPVRPYRREHDLNVNVAKTCASENSSVTTGLNSRESRQRNLFTDSVDSLQVSDSNSSALRDILLSSKSETQSEMIDTATQNVSKDQHPLSDKQLLHNLYNKDLSSEILNVPVYQPRSQAKISPATRISPRKSPRKNVASASADVVTDEVTSVIGISSAFVPITSVSSLQTDSSVSNASVTPFASSSNPITSNLSISTSPFTLEAASSEFKSPNSTLRKSPRRTLPPKKFTDLLPSDVVSQNRARRRSKLNVSPGTVQVQEETSTVGDTSVNFSKADDHNSPSSLSSASITTQVTGNSSTVNDNSECSQNDPQKIVSNLYRKVDGSQNKNTSGLSDKDIQNSDDAKTESVSSIGPQGDNISNANEVTNITVPDQKKIVGKKISKSPKRTRSPRKKFTFQRPFPQATTVITLIHKHKEASSSPAANSSTLPKNNVPQNTAVSESISSAPAVQSESSAQLQHAANEESIINETSPKSKVSHTKSPKRPRTPSTPSSPRTSSPRSLRKSPGQTRSPIRVPQVAFPLVENVGDDKDTCIDDESDAINETLDSVSENGDTVSETRDNRTDKIVLTFKLDSKSPVRKTRRSSGSWTVASPNISPRCKVLDRTPTKSPHKNEPSPQKTTEKNVVRNLFSSSGNDSSADSISENKTGNTDLQNNVTNVSESVQESQPKSTSENETGASCSADLPVASSARSPPKSRMQSRMSSPKVQEPKRRMNRSFPKTFEHEPMLITQEFSFRRKSKDDLSPFIPSDPGELEKLQSGEDPFFTATAFQYHLLKKEKDIIRTKYYKTFSRQGMSFKHDTKPYMPATNYTRKDKHVESIPKGKDWIQHLYDYKASHLLMPKSLIYRPRCVPENFTTTPFSNKRKNYFDTLGNPEDSSTSSKTLVKQSSNETRVSVNVKKVKATENIIDDGIKIPDSLMSLNPDDVSFKTSKDGVVYLLSDTPNVESSSSGNVKVKKEPKKDITKLAKARKTLAQKLKELKRANSEQKGQLKSKYTSPIKDEIFKINEQVKSAFTPSKSKIDPSAKEVTTSNQVSLLKYDESSCSDIYEFKDSPKAYADRSTSKDSSPSKKKSPIKSNPKTSPVAKYTSIKAKTVKQRRQFAEVQRKNALRKLASKNAANRLPEDKTSPVKAFWENDGPKSRAGNSVNNSARSPGKGNVGNASSEHASSPEETKAECPDNESVENSDNESACAGRTSRTSSVNSQRGRDGSESPNSKRKKRMLKELESSAGYIGPIGERRKAKADTLYADPSQLDREARALQRAIMQFSQMEVKQAMKRETSKQQTQQKAQQIKKKACSAAQKSAKINSEKRQYEDFVPKILDCRTRNQRTDVKNTNLSEKEQELMTKCTVKVKKGFDFDWKKKYLNPPTSPTKHSSKTSTKSTPTAKASTSTKSSPSKAKRSPVKKQWAIKPENLDVIDLDRSGEKFEIEIDNAEDDGEPVILGIESEESDVLALEDYRKSTNRFQTDEWDDMYSVGTSASTDSKMHLPPEIKRISANRDTGENIMHKAARLGYEDIILWCLQNYHCGPNDIDHAGFSPLHESCATGHVRIAQFLLAYGANSNIASRLDGIRPFHDAIMNDHIEMARLLLAFGADPRLSSYSGRTVVDMIRSKEMREFLNGISVDLNGVVGIQEKEAKWGFNDFPLEEESDDEDEVLGINIFDQIPSDEPDDAFDVSFDMSDKPHVPTYYIKIDEKYGPSNYAVLLDVLEVLKQSSWDFMSENPGATVCHMTWDHFIVAVSSSSQISPPCKWIPDPGHKRKQSVDLVLLDDCLRRILDADREEVSHQDAEREMYAPCAMPKGIERKRPSVETRSSLELESSPPPKKPCLEPPSKSTTPSSTKSTSSQRTKSSVKKQAIVSPQITSFPSPKDVQKKESKKEQPNIIRRKPTPTKVSQLQNLLVAKNLPPVMPLPLQPTAASASSSTTDSAKTVQYQVVSQTTADQTSPPQRQWALLNHDGTPVKYNDIRHNSNSFIIIKPTNVQSNPPVSASPSPAQSYARPWASTEPTNSQYVVPLYGTQNTDTSPVQNERQFRDGGLTNTNIQQPMVSLVHPNSAYNTSGTSELNSSSLSAEHAVHSQVPQTAFTYTPSAQTVQGGYDAYFNPSEQGADHTIHHSYPTFDMSVNPSEGMTSVHIQPNNTPSYPPLPRLTYHGNDQLPSLQTHTPDVDQRGFPLAQEVDHRGYQSTPEVHQRGYPSTPEVDQRAYPPTQEVDQRGYPYSVYGNQNYMYQDQMPVQDDSDNNCSLRIDSVCSLSTLSGALDPSAFNQTGQGNFNGNNPGWS